MSEPSEYETMFESVPNGREKLKLFANSLAKFEANKGLKPGKVLVNGIIVDDNLSAVFDVKKSNISEVLEYFIDIPGLDPDIIVNGIPADDDIRQVVVNVGRIRP